ncbi:TPA: hypothetical protein ACKP1B_001834 [Serratia fonticola]
MFKKLSTVAVVLTMLNGCAQVNDSLKSINQTLAASTNALKAPLRTTDKSVEQICAEVKRNPARANKEFGGLVMSASGVVRLSDSYGLGHEIFILKSGNNAVAVSGYPDMLSLNDGESLQVKGTISNINKDLGCIIMIDNATKA